MVGLWSGCGWGDVEVCWRCSGGVLEFEGNVVARL